MINHSQPDTIDERVINTKKRTMFTGTVSTRLHVWMETIQRCSNVVMCHPHPTVDPLKKVGL